MKPLSTREKDYDYIFRTADPCPVCKQVWPDKPDIMVNEEHGFVYASGKCVPLPAGRIRLLTVLSQSWGRFVTAESLIDRGYSDCPDADMPDPSIVSTAITGLRRALIGTEYEIETRYKLGYRLQKIGEKKKEARSDDFAGLSKTTKRAAQEITRHAAARNERVRVKAKEGRRRAIADARRVSLAGGGSGQTGPKPY